MPAWRMSTRQAFDDARSLGQAGAFRRHPEARDREPGIHFAGPWIALNRKVAGVIAMSRKHVFFQQMFLDRRWIPPALRREARILRTPPGLFLDAVERFDRPGFRAGGDELGEFATSV